MPSRLADSFRAWFCRSPVHRIAERVQSPPLIERLAKTEVGRIIDREFAA